MMPPRAVPLPSIELAVGASNQINWNGRPLAMSQLQALMQEQVRMHADNLPELRIAADPASECEVMARILAAANNAHMDRIAFVQ